MSDRPPEAVILDLDGTVYRGDGLIPGAAEAIERVRAADITVLFLTNKPISRRVQYSEKLTRLGIPATRDEVINSGWVTAQYLAEKYPDHRALVIGEPPLVEELEDANLDVTTTEPGDLVVASMDRQFTYEKLDLALQTLGPDTPFVATNPDRTCPTADGEIPDAAGMIGAIEGVTGYNVDAILGKPSEAMVETATGVLGVSPADCVMVGDRPETDIKMGVSAGMDTVLVLSGIASADDVTSLPDEPTHVIDSIASLPSVLDLPMAVTDE